MWQLCLNFKMSKFTLQVNQSHERLQFSQTISRRFQMRIQMRQTSKMECLTKN